MEEVGMAYVIMWLLGLPLSLIVLLWLVGVGRWRCRGGHPLVPSAFSGLWRAWRP